MPSFTPFSLNANAEDGRLPLKGLLGAQSPKFLQIAIRQFFQRVFAQLRPSTDVGRIKISQCGDHWSIFQ